MLFRQDERWVAELSVQLQLDRPITASGSVLTLPAATLDLQDWMGDQCEFLRVQYDDWQQVIGDYRDSVAKSGRMTGMGRSRLARATARVAALSKKAPARRTVLDRSLADPRRLHDTITGHTRFDRPIPLAQLTEQP